MKRLEIYLENDEYVIERVNEFNNATKRYYATEEDFFEGLDTYKDTFNEYELNVSEELWSNVIHFISTGERVKSHGGRREGAGRPSGGETRKVSITLPEETWDLIEARKGSAKMSAFLRDVILSRSGMDIYFVEQQHRENFERTLSKWPTAQRDMEYQVACYILAVPMIFEAIEHLFDGFKKPVDWIWQYLSWLEEYDDAWEDYSKYRDDDELHPAHDAWIDRKPFDLTGSMVQFGKFALNMWNGYEDFNLMRCIGSLDEENYKVLKCAMDLRMGAFK